MLWNAILLALAAMRRNVMRSSLTVLGIIIGVAAIIIIVTIGDGATVRVGDEISSLGTNMMMVTPGQEMHGFGSGIREEAKSFEASDAEALLEEVAGVISVAPMSSKPVHAIFGNNNWSSTICGTDNEYLNVRNWALASGREFSEIELRSGRAVCIIGATVRKELFGDQDPTGHNIRLQSISSQVIGLLETKGQSGMGMDQDDIILMPLRTYQRRVSGTRYIDTIMISRREGSDPVKVKSDIERLLRQRRQIQSGNNDDFDVDDSKEIMDTLTGITKLLTMLLSAVAAVSLLVGGIGIMNIMLVSVTERTHEIGIRLAIGAFEHDVMLQFLVESIVLSSLGGVIGIFLGMSVSAAITKLLGVPFAPNIQIAIIAFAFSALVGVLFGFFPARKAARLDPIEALRHE